MTAAKTAPNSDSATTGPTGLGLQLVDRKRAARLMENAGLDILLAHTPLNGGYLADFFDSGRVRQPYFLNAMQETYTAFVGLPADVGIPPFITGSTGGNAADLGAFDPWIKDRYLFGAEKPRSIRVDTAGTDRPVSRSSEEAASLALTDRGLERARIGIEGAFLPIATFERLKALLPEAKFVDGLEVLHDLRLIKTPEELQRIEVACTAARRAHLAIHAFIREGMNGFDITRIVTKAFADVEAEVEFLEVHANLESALLFGPSNNEIKAAEPFSVDLGARYLGYVSDRSHLHCVGQAPQRTRVFHGQIVEAFQAVEANLRPGVVAHELWALGHEALLRTGVEPPYRMVGHGMGRHIHERPVLGPDDHTVIEEGMVLAIELPMFHPEVGWVQVEENFVVEEGGARMLAPYKLDILELPV